MLLTRKISLHNELITKTTRQRRSGAIGSQAIGTESLSFSPLGFKLMSSLCSCAVGYQKNGTLHVLALDDQILCLMVLKDHTAHIHHQHTCPKKKQNRYLSSCSMEKHLSYNDLSRGCRAQIFSHRHPCLIPYNPPKQWAWLSSEWARFYQILRGSEVGYAANTMIIAG